MDACACISLPTVYFVDDNLPEEVNRRMIDVTSDINLCYSEHARRYALASGTKPQYTFVVGSTMAEVLTANLDAIQSSRILDILGLEPHKYILLSAHREENIDIEANFLALMDAVNAMAEQYDMPILYSCHPRSKKYIEQRDGEKQYETLLSQDECDRAADMGGFYRVSRDKPAAETRGTIAEFHSNNAIQLTVEQVKKKLLTLPYIQAELGAWAEQNRKL